MQIISGNIASKPYALTAGSNIATDAALSNNFSVTLTSNCTLDNPTNLVHGMFLSWLVDNGTSPYTLAYGSKFKWGKGGTADAPVLSTTASKKHVISGFYDSASDTILAAMLDTSVTQPFDAAAFYPGIPTSSAVLLRIPIARAVSFASNFSGSYGKASAASTGTATFDVQKNGVSCGSVVFTSSATATFTTSGAVNFAAGDVLSIIAPGSADATLADIGITLAGTR